MKNMSDKQEAVFSNETSTWTLFLFAIGGIFR